jgi:hypothetical protein
MTTARRLPLRAACLVALLAAFAPAHALDRTAVSVKGSDANNCAVVTPCRTIAYAITQTTPGGEVVVLDSAGYGAFTVDRALTVQAAPGVYAGVTAASGNAIQINAGASDTIVLRGLVVNGLGTASAGIAFIGGGAELHVENCVVAGFQNWAILSYFPIRIQDTTLRDSGTGVHVDNAGAPVNATLDRVRLQNNATNGVLSWRNAVVTVRDSFAALNGIGFAARAGGVLNVERGTASGNGTGVAAAVAGQAGTVRLGQSMVVDNTTGVAVGTGLVETWGDNAIRGNGTDLSGALTLVPDM